MNTTRTSEADLPAAPPAGEPVGEVVPPSSARRLSVAQRIFVVQAAMFSALTVVLGAVQVGTLNARVRDEYGERALVLSRTVAATPSVQEYFRHPERRVPINPVMTRLREAAHADFLVVGSRLGIRYAHPFPQAVLDHLRSGRREDDVLAPGAPVQVGEGDLKNFVWGQTTVRDDAGKPLGVVSAGYLLPNVQGEVTRVLRGLVPWYLASLAIAVASSGWLSRRVRRDTLGLEPEQIAGLVLQHRAVLSSLQEGVMVVDAAGAIQLLNPTAEAMLAAHRPGAARLLPLVWPELHVLHRTQAGNFQAVPVHLGHFPVLVSRYALERGQHVFVLRDRAEVMRLAEELTQARQYADLLRAQTHEFMNRLHTISGLIQLGQERRALDVIRTVAHRGDSVQAVLDDVALPQVAALLLGKFERARELGVGFEVAAGSALGADWGDAVQDTLVVALGNLIENAFEAARAAGDPEVVVALGEDPDGLEITVTDNGPGVPAAVADTLFERGVSTKGPGRGVGLALVRQHLRFVRGDVRHERRDGRTVFEIAVPRE